MVAGNGIYVGGNIDHALKNQRGTLRKKIFTPRFFWGVLGHIGTPHNKIFAPLGIFNAWSIFPGGQGQYFRRHIYIWYDMVMVSWYIMDNDSGMVLVHKYNVP